MPSLTPPGGVRSTLSSLPPGRALVGAAAVIGDGTRALFGAAQARHPALDALRAAAIFVVMAQHWPGRFKLGSELALPVGQYPPFSVGFVGVDLFFVLSGFLIGRPLWKELAAKGTISFARFFLRRSFRIWPYYYFALLAWTIWHPAEHPTVQVSELFFFANYVHGGGIPGSWSLSTEEQFYILAPLLILALRRRIPLWGYFVVFGALEAAVVAARYHAVGVIAASAGRFGYFEQLHLHADGLLFGLGLSLLSVLRPAWLRPDRGRPRRGWAVFAAGCAAAFGLYAINREVYNLLSLAIIFTSLTYALLTDPSRLQKLWRWRGFQTFSMLSFGMYLNQFLVLAEFGRFWGRVTRGVLPPNLAFFLGFALGVALCCALAAITYVLIEHPFLMLRDRRLKPPQLADLGWKPGAADQPAS